MTGEDTGIGECIHKLVGINATRFVFEDCTFKGSMARLFHGYTGLGSVQFINCDTSNVTDMSYMFYGCRTALTSLDLTGLDTSNVTDMSYMFYGCRALDVIDLSGFDTSNVTNMSYMFYNCNGAYNIDVSGLNTSKVTDMSFMFYGCSSVRNIDVTNFDTSSVTNMSSMFYGCNKLESLDVSGLDTSNITDMSAMFERCYNLKTIDLARFNTSKVTNMSHMFWGCESLRSIDLRGFDTSNVTDISGMFCNCESLTSININSFDTSKVTNMSSLFSGCERLESIDVSGLDTSKATSISSMFDRCYRLTSIDITGFDTSNVIYMSSLFSDCENLVSIYMSGLDTSKATDMSAMFSGCEKLTSIDISEFDTSNALSIGSMFSGCKNLKYVDVSGFDTSKVTSMGGLFSGCMSLTSLDVSGFDTSNVYNMAYMFSECTNLSSLDLSGFDTSNVTNMSFMFYRCNNLSSIDLTSFDTSNVTSMKAMFSENKNLKELDVTDFDTSNVADMSYMFSQCTNLLSLDVSGFDTSNVSDMSWMFKECTKLESIDVSGFNTSKVKDMSHMFYQCESLQSIDISGFNTSKLKNICSMFERCKSLTSINLTGFRTIIVNDVTAVFKGCEKLENIDLSGFNISYTDMLEGCNNLRKIYTPQKASYAITLPSGFYDETLTPVSAITPLYCNTVLIRALGSKGMSIDTRMVSCIRVRDSYGKIISDATVYIDDNKCLPNEEGIFYIEKDVLFSGKKIIVSKEGYCTYSLDISEISPDKFHTDIRIFKIGEEELMLSYVTNYGENYQTTDLLTNIKTFNIKNENDVVWIITSVMEPDKIAEYQLWQKNEKLATSNNGTFKLGVDEGFTTGGGCFIRVVGKSGMARDTYINLSFVSIDVRKDAEVNLLEEPLKIEVDEDVPFFGDLEVDIDMPALSMQAKITSDKIYIGFNTDFDEEAEEDEVEEFFSDLKEAMDVLEKADNIVLGKKQADEMKKFIKSDDAFKLPGGDYGVEIGGYAECDTGQMVAKGQLYVLLSAETPTFGFTTWVVVVPVTVHIKGEAELKATAEFSYDLETGKLDGSLALDIEVGVEAFGGIGVGQAIGVGAYGGASVSVGINVLGKNKGVQLVTLHGELGIKAYVGPFSYSKAFAENDWTLYKKKTQTYSLTSGSSYNLYSPDSYELESLDYLLEQSEWCGYPVMTNDVDVTTNFMPLLENTYLNAQPVMVADGDVLYAAFLGADASTGEIYVQCTKMENGIWCEPVRVDSEAILDNAPQLLIDNDGNVWLTYAKTGESYETGSLLSYAKNQSIVVGMLNKDTLTLTNVKEYNSSDYAHMQQLSLVNGVPTLSFIESVVTDEASVLNSLNNKIVSASYTDGAWGDLSVVKEVNTYMSDMATGDIGIAYIMDEDGELTTLTDKMLVYCDWQGNELKTISGVNGNVTYGTLPGETEGTFIWNDSDKLSSLETSIDVAGITGEYVINGNSIYYSKPVKNGAELCVIRMNSDGTFSNPIQLTNTDRYIENISVATAYGKDIVLGMHTSAKITSDDFSTSKNLVWSIVQPVNDIRIDEVYYDTSVTTPDEKLDVTLTVTNAGENTVDNVSISLDDNVVSTQNVSLKPGESKDVTFELSYPSVLTEYKVKVEDTASDISLDYNPDDNSTSFKLGYTNIKVDASLEKFGNDKTIVAMVTNTGTESATGTVALLNEEGKLLTLYSFTDLEREKTTIIEMPLDADILDTTLTVTVITQQEEMYTYDNTDTVYIPVEEGFHMINYVLDGGIQNINNPTVYYEADEDIVLLNPVKDGFDFDGWYTDMDYTTKVTHIDTSSATDMTLYAKWVEKIEPLEISATVDKNQINIGDSVVLSATATGGDGNYTYSFLVYNMSTGKWTRLRKEFTEDNSYTWKAEAAGNCKFFIEVKDGTGQVVRSSALQVNVMEELKITAQSTSNIVSVGDTIKLTATATGGDGNYTYSFLVYNMSTGKWARLRKEFTENNSYTWKASTAENRKFFIEVKDGTGNVVRSSALEINVVEELKISAQSTSNAVSIGDKIKLSATATGGDGNYTYSFLVYNMSTGKWARLRKEFTEDNSYTWKATSEGNRKFFIEVKDGTGKVVRSEALVVNVD